MDLRQLWRPVRGRLWRLALLLRERPWAGASAGLVALVVLLLVAVVVTGGGGEGKRPEYLEPRVEAEPALAERVPYDGRSPRLAQDGNDLRVLVELPRPALGARRDLERLSAAERRAYVFSLKDESRTLRSALEARGARLREVATFERAWNGFAATIREADLVHVNSLGVRTRPIRRFFPVISEPVPDPAALDAPAAKAAGRPVALLAGGAPGTGYDAVDADADPRPEADPRDVGRPEVSGTALERVLEDLGARVVPVRVASLRPTPQGTEEHARTDELLAGLEYAVDPDRDGDPADGAAVALVGVNAPYAGFRDAPEAEAASAARRLGTVVVAAAGHEGPGDGPFGTIGSPGAAARAVTVGALAAPGPAARLELQVGGLRMRGAALLGGTPFGQPLRSGAAAGQVAVVEAGEHPPAAAARAAAAGAAADVLAEARPERPLTAMPAGLVGVPVIGVTGASARALLALPAGLEVRTSGYASSPPGEPGQAAAPASSTGPTFAGAAKPDWLAPGTAAGVAGAGVAAARVAAALARKPDAKPPGAIRPKRGRRPPRPRRVPVGEPAVEREDDRVTGARFTVGAFERGDPVGGRRTAVAPAERLELTLEAAGGQVVRRLTPPGGEQGLLPGEYRYTLPRGVLADLDAGTYRFVVRARGPRQRRPTVARSAPFRVS